jgi:hypothetical protein
MNSLFRHLSVQVSARCGRMIKPIKLTPEMQQAPLEITDHQIVTGAAGHNPGNFVFDELLLPLEISNVI